MGSLQTMGISGRVTVRQPASGNVEMRVPITGLANVTNKPIKELRFLPFSEFPVTGNINILYIDTTGNAIYYWNESSYALLSGDDKIIAKTTVQWQALTSLVSTFGTIYIYTDYRQEDGVNIPAIKIGDGLAYVVDLPFFDTGVTPADRLKWDNKIAAKISPIDAENLILYTD